MLIPVLLIDLLLSLFTVRSNLEDEDSVAFEFFSKYVAECEGRNSPICMYVY